MQAMFPEFRFKELGSFAGVPILDDADDYPGD